MTILRSNVQTKNTYFEKYKMSLNDDNFFYRFTVEL